jgi:hypothetical protein
MKSHLFTSRDSGRRVRLWTTRAILTVQGTRGRETPVAVAVQLDFAGATLEQYDQINERIGALPGGPAPPQELFHWVTKTETGFRVLDVWESRQAFERFTQKLFPIFDEVGLPHPPEIQFFAVHNYLAGGRWRG